MSHAVEAAAVVALLAALPVSIRAQRDTLLTRDLSLERAIAIALEASESVRISAADVDRAEAFRRQAASERWPQVLANASYTRTLRTQFAALGGDDDNGAPDVPPAESCGPLAADPGLPADERLRRLEQAVRCLQSGAGFSSIANRLPFGRPNQWLFGASVSQSLYSGGRIGSQIGAADAVRTQAELGLQSTRAEQMLTVARAYFDAQLADRFVEIAEASIDLAEETLGQTQVMRKVGTRPQFDVLRARVALESLQPALIQQRAARELAYMRLKQLLDLPLESAVTLSSSLDGMPAATLEPAADERSRSPERAPVLQAAEALRADTFALRAAEAQRLPSVSLSAQFQQVAYPTTFVPTGDYLSNWTVGVGVSVPVFTGGRVGASIAAARAARRQSALRLAQTRELAELDSADARLQFEAAVASWRAIGGTVGEATETVRIATIRFREGLSTQIEIADARLLLQQARANQARAERDVRLAQLRLRLLPDLPLGTTAPAVPSAMSAAAATQGTQGSDLERQQNVGVQDLTPLLSQPGGGP